MPAGHIGAAVGLKTTRTGSVLPACVSRTCYCCVSVDACRGYIVCVWGPQNTASAWHAIPSACVHCCSRGDASCMVCVQFMRTCYISLYYCWALMTRWTTVWSWQSLRKHFPFFNGRIQACWCFKMRKQVHIGIIVIYGWSLHHCLALIGQTLLSGMGELHIDVTLERLRREYNVFVKLGRVRVAYRESVTSSVEHQVCAD